MGFICKAFGEQKKAEASNGYEQVKALIAFPFAGVDFYCNVALGFRGGTSS
jgi:hypothetical protein